MSTIALTIFRIVVFPHEGKLVTLDQPSFTQKGHMETNESTIPLVDQVTPSSERLEAGMYSWLMGTFDLLAPINYLGSTSIGKSIAMVVDRMDPSFLPSHHELEVPLSATKLSYQAIIHTAFDPVLIPLILRGARQNLSACLGRELFAYSILLRYGFSI